MSASASRSAKRKHEEFDAVFSEELDPRAKYRAWVYTCNNFTDDDKRSFAALAERAVYWCQAPEVGESGTPHLQGFIRFENAISLQSLKKSNARAHFAAAKGTDKQNRTYIFGPYDKDDKHKPANPDAEELGTMAEQGKRTDIEVVREQVVAGQSMQQIALTARSYQSIRTAEILYKYIDMPRTEQPKIYWFYGPTGCGKSYSAENDIMSPDGPKKVFCPLTSKWWDGYEREEVVIFDDVRSSWFDAAGGFSWILRLGTRLPFRVETKGGSRQMVAKRVYITAPFSPDELFCHYAAGEDLQQLHRRITEIRHFNTPYV